jgi:hypothetical protein
MAHALIICIPVIALMSTENKVGKNTVYAWKSHGIFAPAD